MPKIWFRVGMEADVSEEEYSALVKGSEGTMLSVIAKAKISGETYIVGKNNGLELYDNPCDDVDFVF